MKYIDETTLFNNIVYQRQVITESNINRLIKWLTTTDCGFITAFRKELKDIVNTNKTYFGKNEEWREGHIFTHEENRQKNQDMVSKILVKGYGVIKVKGIYPEGMTKESSEESYMVFDNNNKGGLYDFLLELGEYYNQDSIYFKPKDSLIGYLIGTNGTDFPGYHQKGTESKFMINTASNYMSRFRNSSFSFVSDDAIKNNNKKEAMDDIAKEIVQQGYPTQHYWEDNDKTSFKKRKQQRIINNEDIIYNLLTLCENKGIETLTSLHPLTRKSLCEHYNKSINNTFNMNNYIKNQFISIIQENKSVKENNFLWEFRPHTTNNGKLVSINEVNVKSMLDRHSENGFIAISPCRGYADFDIDPSEPDAQQKLAEINNKRIKECISLIKASGFSYTPVYSGFIENQGTDDEQNVYERSFIVYNNKKDGEAPDFKELYDFGIELARKYNQDSVLVKAPGEPPRYITQNGDVDMEFSGKTSFNDLSQEYFTDMHKNTDKFGNISNRRPTRFSYVESYINPAPQCLNEAHVRALNGEIFIPYRH